MNNKIRIISAFLIIASFAVIAFSGCGGKDEKPSEAESSAADLSVSESSLVSESSHVSESALVLETEISSETEKAENNSETVATENSATSAKAASTKPRSSTPPESVRSDGTYTYYYYSEKVTERQTEKKTESAKGTTVSRTVSNTKANNQPAKTTSKPAATTSASTKVEEINSGVSVITKTSPVGRGDSATIIIMGTPGAKYSIEFYESDKKVASYSGLENKTADSSGICSWTFKIGSSCEPGERKIIIKEKNSGNYAQTSISVQ